MTSFSKSLLMTAAALVMAGVASAQTVKADIPFAFKVGNKLMNPGNYILKIDRGSTGTDLLTIANLDDKTSAMTMPTERDPNREWTADGKARLAFECGEDRCSLVQVWRGGNARIAYAVAPAKTHGEKPMRSAVILAEPLKGE